MKSILKGAFAISLVGGLLLACVGDSNSVIDISDSGADGAPSNSDAAGMSMTDGASSSTMDGASFDANAPCSAASNTCNAEILVQCNANGIGFKMTPCAYGCATTGTPHCKILVPSAGLVVASDLNVTGVMPIVFPVGITTLDTDTGAITGGITRAANSVITKVEVVSGIAFHQTNVGGISAGVFSFANVTIAAGATLKLRGTGAVALVSADKFVSSGVIEVRGMDGTGAICPSGSLIAGPGGGAGGTAGHGGVGAVAGGKGGGTGGGFGGNVALTVDPGGGGGAGHDVGGGVGSCGCSAGMVQPGGVAGGAFDNYPEGGSGGGGGGGAAGGGGGGSLQIVAANVITIGDGTAIQGINAGGCGGQGAKGGGGGGAGGRIRLDAPVVQIAAKGTLAANGGGGGGAPASTATDGTAGGLSATLSYGAGASSFSPNAGGGNGGAGDTPTGTGAITCATCGANEGYGGGGSAGRILINALGAAPTVNGTAVLSPSVVSKATAYGSVDVE